MIHMEIPFESVSSQSSEAGVAPSIPFSTTARTKPPLCTRRLARGTNPWRVWSSERSKCVISPFITMHLHPPADLLFVLVNNSIHRRYVERNQRPHDRHPGCRRTRATTPSVDPRTGYGCAQRLRSYHEPPRASIGRRARTARWSGRAREVGELLCVRQPQPSDESKC